MAKVKTAELLTNTGLTIASGVAGGIVGSAVGRKSLMGGVICILGGTYLELKGKPLGRHIAAAGVGMAAAPSQVTTAPVASEVQGLSGLKGLAVDAKQRGGMFVKELAHKMYLPVSVKSKLGLGEAPMYLKTPSMEISASDAQKAIAAGRTSMDTQVKGMDLLAGLGTTNRDLLAGVM